LLATRRLSRIRGGGTGGNSRLTALAGSALLLPLLVVGVTLLSLRGLMDVHLFVGLLLIPPVLLKMASTGYRFMRYYTHDPAYRRRGVPPALLRVLAPGVVASTLVVLASGVALLIVGPHSRGALVPIHKVSFIVWAALTGLHVLAHLGQAQRSLAGELAPAGIARGARLAGRDGRLISVAGALVAGAVLALLLVPDFAAWVQWSAHHHHGH
jgi:hypothetical protein